MEQAKTQAGLLAVAGISEEVSTFFRYAQHVADDALYNYQGKENIKNWPNSVEELIKLMDKKLAGDRVELTAVSTNPFQDLVNNVGGAINGVSSAISNTVNNITNPAPKNNTFSIVGGISSIGGNATKTNNTFGNPIGDVLGGVTSGLGGLVGNLTNGLGSAVGNLTNGVGTAVGGLGNVVGGVTNGLGNIVHDVAGNATSGINNIVTSLTNTTGNLLENLTGGIISHNFLNDTLGFLGGSIAGILDGKVDLASVLKQGLDKLLTFTGANNPLGKFIQSIAQYLSEKPDSLLANAIKVFTFINSVTDTVNKIFGNVVKNGTQDIQNFVQGIISKLLFGGSFGLHFIQTMTPAEANALQEHFLNAVRAEGSPVAVAYTETMVDILNKLVQRMSIANPNAFSVIYNPSDENIRNFVVTAAKAVSDN